jgi:6-pyruvoyltetrahydropterin/6-carboxytetrahydropterin synthase
MNRLRITKEFNFEMAHALWNYDGACRNIHGHSYKLYVTVAGIPNPDNHNPKFGMVMDFKDLKQMIKKPVVDLLDHSLAIYKEARNEAFEEVRKMYDKVHVFDFQPTCENLVLFIVERIQSILPDNLVLHSVKLNETATSFAEWYASDN